MKRKHMPAKYSSARVYGTTGGYTKALDWHLRGPAEDRPVGPPRRRVRRQPTGGQCQGKRMYGKVEGVCGLPEGHSVHVMHEFYQRLGWLDERHNWTHKFIAPPEKEEDAHGQG